MTARDISDITKDEGVSGARAFMDSAMLFVPPAKPNGHGYTSELLKPESITPFEAFDAGDWEDVPIEPRRWLVSNRIPTGEPGLLSGDGGSGKTKLVLQLGVSVACELPDWVGGVVETHGPVLVFSAEEKLKEMHRRINDIVTYRGLSFRDLKNRIRFICDLDDVILGKVDRERIVQPTMALLRLEKTIQRFRPALIIIENAADVYAGDENDRASVTRFVRKLLGGLTQLSEAAVVLIQHPSVAGLQDGTGRSGTTGWNNSGRFRLNFTIFKPDGENEHSVRRLEVVKSNFGPTGEKALLRWCLQNRVFLPLGSGNTPERAAAEKAIDDAFLKCVDAATAQNRAASPNKGSTYAPAVFERMPEAVGLNRRALAAAMERLLSTGRIVGKSVGSPSKPRTQLVRSQ
jgi:RecA-family ATPase